MLNAGGGEGVGVRAGGQLGLFEYQERYCWQLHKIQKYDLFEGDSLTRSCNFVQNLYFVFIVNCIGLLKPQLQLFI